MSRRRWARADVAVLAVVAVAVAVLGLATGRRARPADDNVLPRAATALTLSDRTAERPIPSGFLGLSLEYRAIDQYAGGDPASPNPAFLSLVRNVAGPSPVLRIGGDSTDWTWWPVAGVDRPPGITYTLTAQRLAVLRALAVALRPRLVLGINLEADSTTLAAAETSALLGAVGRGSVLALEPGNEPELYGAFAWYRTASGRRVTGRPRSYNFTAFTRDFTRFAAALSAGVALAGPTASGPGWMRDVGRFIAAEPRVRIVTLHRYPLQLCFASQRPTVGQLLSNSASRGLAQSFAANAAIAHRAGRVLRVDELNTVSCGADPAVSQSFASALWALDTLFEMAAAGVDGVNLHTFPGAGYALFGFRRAHGRWTAWVAPEYYGLRMFAQAAPGGSRLLRVAGAGEGLFKAWAVKAPDGTVHLVLINKDVARGWRIAVRVAGVAGAASAARAALVERLTAPGVRASAGVTLRSAGRIEPSGSAYVVTVPPASAAVLTLTRLRH